MSAQTLTVPLKKPIKVGDRDVSELTFRPAILEDLIAAESVGSRGIHAASSALMACMAGITVPEIRQISVEDYKALDKALRPLMGNDEADEDGGPSPS